MKMEAGGGVPLGRFLHVIMLLITQTFCTRAQHVLRFTEQRLPLHHDLVPRGIV